MHVFHKALSQTTTPLPLYQHVINQEEQALDRAFIHLRADQQLIAIQNLHGMNTQSSCYLMKFAAGKRQELPGIPTVLNFLEGVSSTRQCTEANAVLLAPTEDVDVSCIALHEAAATSKTKLDDQRMQLTHVNHHEDEECCNGRSMDASHVTQESSSIPAAEDSSGLAFSSPVSYSTRIAKHKRP
uniref:Uncharacterized protein n=1 Tax=Echinococcus granulosus TaxID=6210 RepID=A0A068W9H1_ECHGR|nr:hypothetical protein EgrG_002012500 [Echinococcus granulosus]